MNITEDPSYTTTRSAYIELEQKHWTGPTSEAVLFGPKQCSTDS
jgi:hypothetical protein